MQYQSNKSPDKWITIQNQKKKNWMKNFCASLRQFERSNKDATLFLGCPIIQMLRRESRQNVKNGIVLENPEPIVTETLIFREFYSYKLYIIPISCIPTTISIIWKCFQLHHRIQMNKSISCLAFRSHIYSDDFQILTCGQISFLSPRSTALNVSLDIHRRTHKSWMHFLPNWIPHLLPKSISSSFNTGLENWLSKPETSLPSALLPRHWPKPLDWVS